MRRTQRASGRDDGTRSARRRGRHRARSCRAPVPAVLSVVVLVALTATVLLSLVRPRPAAGDPTAAARRASTEGVAVPMATGDRRQCIALLTAGLHADLVAMNKGLPVEGASTDQLIANRWPAGSPARVRVTAAYDAVLLTAASDLFGRYARDVAAEVTGYGPRIAAACG